MSQRDRLLDHIRRLALQGMGERRTDGQLLESFISERDEAAFALLLRRHGAMVWSVCRRILGNSHDADDAFQAVFLVLVRKADSVRPREAVGNWLYGVAYRTALEARGRIARRRTKERTLQDVPQPEGKTDTSCPELGPILDRELSRLADKYRLPIVLCDLEGRSRKEVAEQLAIPEGTLSSRLATARKKLAARLARYGFTASGMSLTALLAENTATAGISPILFATTTKAAVLIAAGPAAASIVSATVSTLTEGVIKTMFIAKIKTATLLVCSVAALGVGTGGVYYQTRVGAADPQQLDRAIVQDNRKEAPQAREREIDKLKRENDRLKNELARSQRIAEVLEVKLRSLEDALERGPADQKARSSPNRESAEKSDPNAVEEKFRAEQVKLVEEYQARWKELQKKRKDVEDQQKMLEKVQRTKITELDAQVKKLAMAEQQLREEVKSKVAELDERRNKILRGQSANPTDPKGSQTRGGDKLDQILQRLERMEKRLDRLEKGRQ